MCPRDLIRDEGFMSLSTMEKIISQINPLDFWEIDLAGRGEPTIHPQFSELTEIMRRSQIKTGVVTTGVTFNEKNARAAGANLDRIRLSVSSFHKETFDKVHIGLDHARIWTNIKNIASYAADKVIIHLTGGPVIYDRLPETVSHLRNLGFTKIHLFPFGIAAEHLSTIVIPKNVFS